MLVIRTAEPSDRVGVDQITEEFSDHGYSHASSYFDNALISQKILVAIEGGRIVGYLTHHIIWGNTPYIELLRVTSLFQRKGVGLKLLSELEKMLKAAKYEVLISSSERTNEVGNNFHKKSGFEPIGELDMIYGKEVFYKKVLI